MGSLVGALYAVNPRSDTTESTRGLLRQYRSQSEADAQDSGFGMGLLSMLLVAVSGGTALPVLLGGAAGAVYGASTTRPLDHQRLTRVLRRHLSSARFETLPMRFATFHWTLNQTNMDTVVVRSGDVAEAVGDSIANPLIFRELDPIHRPRLDPGGDRVAAVPIEDTCTAFPGHRIVAINTTGRPAMRSAGLQCQVIEIDIPPIDVSNEEVLLLGPAFDRLVEHGYTETTRALRSTVAH